MRVTRRGVLETYVGMTSDSRNTAYGLFSKLEIIFCVFWQKIISLTHLSRLSGLRSRHFLTFYAPSFVLVRRRLLFPYAERIRGKHESGISVRCSPAEQARPGV